MSEARKPNVLLVGEATYLASGYSTYGYEVMKRLHATGQFNLTELGCFGGYKHVGVLDLPWDHIQVVPDPNNPDSVAQYESNVLNKHGAGRFEETCLKVRPDIVFSFRDWWYDEHQFRSPFRQFFHLAHMPTVDSSPQNPQWLTTYAEADAIFSYTDWGKQVLDEEGGGTIPTKCSAPPGADVDVFRSFGDKAGFKRTLGLPADAFIIGTVMRNMKRKLYPDLIETFSRFLREAPDGIRNNTYLYLHCAYPDVGWDIPKLIRENGVSHRTFFTYTCRSCGESYPAHYQDIKCYCRKCGERSAEMPHSSAGISREVLAKIYNVMDLYVQYATHEGFGMGQVEAASCEVPVMATDYSAMSDIVRKLGGTPIRVQRYLKEAETHRDMALPDNDDLLAKIIDFAQKPLPVRMRVGRQGRKGVLEHYTYDKTAKVWADHFLTVPLRDHKTTWLSKSRGFSSNTNFPAGLSNEEWVRWGYANVLNRPDLADSYSALRMVKDLNWGLTCGGMGGGVFNDASAFGLEAETVRVPFNRDKALEGLLNTAGKFNYWESQRTATV